MIPSSFLIRKIPMSFGAFADPSTYTEFRYKQEKAMGVALEKIEEIANEFKDIYGRYYGGLIDGYVLDDAEIVIMAMGSIIGTIKDTIDELRIRRRKCRTSKSSVFQAIPDRGYKEIPEERQGRHNS